MGTQSSSIDRGEASVLYWDYERPSPPLIGMVFSSSFDLESLSGQQLVTSKRRGTQAARGRPAKPFLAGSIPARASILLRILFLLYGILSGGSQILGEETWRRGC
jgi:hypothetical protein